MKELGTIKGEGLSKQIKGVGATKIKGDITKAHKMQSLIS